MPVERRGGSSPLSLGQLEPGGARRFSGRRQPSRGDTSRMNREVQVRICEGLGVKLPGPTRPTLEAQKKGLKNMKFNFSQKQTSRREMLRVSATLAGSAFLAHLFPGTLLRAYAQRAPSAADLVASMRAKFNAAPMETQKLADNVTMFSV